MADTSNPVFAVRLSAVLRVKPFISTDLVRYYLNGVCIEPAANGAICVSTDGHRLGACHDPDGFATEAVIVKVPNEIKMPPKKGFLRSPWLVGIGIGNGKGHVSVVEPAPKHDEDTALNAIERVEDCSIRIGRAFIDGTFPDWRRVIPTPSDKDTVRGFNGAYVKAFGDHMAIRGAGEAAPHLIEIAGEPEFIGVLMPMRAESKGKLPEWLEAPKAAPARKAA
jgi:hypothetical protein